jgi:hypothetical protein
VFVALSFISFRFDRLALAALSVSALWRVGQSGASVVNDVSKWHGPLDTSDIVRNICMAGVWFYFWFFMFLTLRQLYAIPVVERSILREGASTGRFAGATFLQAFCIPPNIRNSTRRVRTVLFTYLANLMSFGPAAFFLISGPLLYVLFWAGVGPLFLGAYDTTRDSTNELKFFSTLTSNIAAFAVALLFVFLLMMTFHLVGTRSLRMARRYMRVAGAGR